MTTALVTEIKNGLLEDLSNTDFPAAVYGFDNHGISLVVNGTAFGFVLEGEGNIVADERVLRVPKHHFFSMPCESRLSVQGNARGYLVIRLNYRGLSISGGPVEEKGRLKYIDGCSDTLLLSPPLRGDPCFNLLHFPKGINQTKHTHPSIRVGLIHSGEGLCHTVNDVLPLTSGKIFILYPDAVHAFSTSDTNGMTLTVFHPDSDFGPTHDDHPMLNRTIVDGVPAKEISEIKTQHI